MFLPGFQISLDPDPVLAPGTRSKKKSAERAPDLVNIRPDPKPCQLVRGKVTYRDAKNCNR